MNLFRIDRISENPKGKILWRKEQIEYIVSQYKQGSSLKKLSDEFQVHRNSVKKVLEENEVYVRNLQESKANPEVKANCFTNIETDEVAYWLGFLAADGNVSGTKIACNLQINDKHHLEKLNQFLGNAHQVTTFKDKKTGKEYCGLTYYSSKMSNDLKQHGIVERKSLILKPPLFLEDKKLQLAWIRGYFDGDGGLSFSMIQRRVQFYFTGTRSVLTWINGVLELDCIPYMEHGCNNTYRISYNGWIQAREKLELLYKNAPVYLDRKYNQFLKLYTPSQHEALSSSLKEEVLKWAKDNSELVLNCKNNNIINDLNEIFLIGKKYNFTDKRSIAKVICGSTSTKEMLLFLKSALQQ